MPEVGLEPTKACAQRILSPSCIPIPPFGQAWARLDSNQGLTDYESAALTN